jgi:hypothetical protein
MDMDALALRTSDSATYTPYLFRKRVSVPFHAAMPPPHPRSASRDDWIHAVPKPYRKSVCPAISLRYTYALPSFPT